MLRNLLNTRAGRVGSAIVDSFFKHDDMSLAAAVAFYTALSFAPLVLLLVTIGGAMGESAQSTLIQFFDRQLGPRASEVTAAVVQNANRESFNASSIRWWIGVLLLLIAASGVFGQLQSALNTIWESPPKPRSGVFGWLRKRLLSLGMVLVAMFILLVSLVLSSIAEHLIPSGDGVMGHITVFTASFVVSTLLFAAIYRVLPDAPVKWRQVWLGALTTAGLFSIGKLVLGVYLQNTSVAEGYGKAAGALIALLIWIYYSCIILFIGAEITRNIWSPAPRPMQGPDNPRESGQTPRASARPDNSLAGTAQPS